MRLFLVNTCLAFFLFTPKLFAQTQNIDQSLIDEILDTTKVPSQKIRKHYHPDGYILETPLWMRSHQTYSNTMYPNFKIRSIFRHKNDIIWNKTYHTARLMSRALPPEIKRKKNAPNLTIMGCSLIFGLGLNDDETIMANLSTLLPEFNIDNISLSGSGPNITLAYLQKEIDPELYRTKEDILIFP